METELLLLNAARKMEQEALVKIFELYAGPLYNYALRLSGNPSLADHVVGDVFAKLLEQLAAGKGPQLFLRAYLYETAYHLIVDEARHANRWAPLDVLISFSSDVRAGQLGFEDQLLFERVVDAIRHDLTADQRHVILLRFLEEFSLRETAAILGKNVSHIKVIQGRALLKLRKIIKYNEMRTARSLPRRSPLSRAVRI